MTYMTTNTNTNTCHDCGAPATAADYIIDLAAERNGVAVQGEAIITATVQGRRNGRTLSVTASVCVVDADGGQWEAIEPRTATWRPLAGQRRWEAGMAFAKREFGWLDLPVRVSVLFGR